MGETLNETVKLIISLSISGGLFTLVLFALKPFMRNRLSKSFQYYIWIVVLLRFMLPFSLGINLMDFTFNTPNTPQTVEETTIPNNNPINPANTNPAITDNTINNYKPDIIEQQPQPPATSNSPKPLNILNLLADNLFWFWLAGVLISSAFNVFGYFRFIRYIHGAAYAVEMPDCGTKVFKSRFASTPMLVGVIRPRIYLPDMKYADRQLKNIMLHELTHLRRHDVWLKWFVALVVSIHWFNPVVYFMRREISRACELSCDEAVIRNLDGAAKQSYGDTLISIVAESSYPVGVMFTTMCEEKKKLKERLVAIMDYKKKTKITIMFTAVLAVAITGSAFAFEADAFGRTLPEKVLTNAVENTKSILNTYYSTQSTGAFEMITTNHVYEFISYSMHEEGDELLLLTNYKNNMTDDDIREQLLKNAVPNQVKNIQTISAIGIEKLLISAESCGIVVETIEGSEYTVDYIGVQNKTTISVSISTENGVLSVLAQGRNENRIVSTVRGSKINVVRIGVPKNSVKEIAVQNDSHGCIMIDCIDVPISGNAGKGSVRVQNETLNADINLEAGSGNVIVKGNTISGKITMTVANGSAYVEGETVDGNLRLSASNGDVNVTAGSIKNGEFTAANGEVNLTIGTIIQKISAEVSNGDMVIQLIEEPTSLRYAQTNKSNADISLPYGWKNGYQVGSGSALLEVSVGNGDYSLTVKQ